MAIDKKVSNFIIDYRKTREKANQCIYSSHLKRRYNHTIKMYLDTMQLENDLAGRIDHNVRILCEIIHLNHNNKTYNSEHVSLIFPMKTFTNMLDNANIDGLNGGIWEITFIIKSERNYEIIKKTRY